MAISVDNDANLGDNGGTTASLTVPYTVSGSNGLLVLCLIGDVIAGNDDISSVTYNGVAMTLVDKNITGFPSGSGPFARMQYLYYLLNPATGSNSLVVTAGSTHYLLACGISFNGVGTIDTSAKQWAPVVTDQTLTTGITTGLDNAWVVIGENGYNSDNSSPTTDGLITTRFDVAGATFGQPGIFHNAVKPLTPAGAYTFTTNRAVGNALGIPMCHILLSFGPVSTQKKFLLIPN